MVRILSGRGRLAVAAFEISSFCGFSTPLPLEDVVRILFGYAFQRASALGSQHRKDYPVPPQLCPAPFGGAFFAAAASYPMVEGAGIGCFAPARCMSGLHQEAIEPSVPFRRAPALPLAPTLVIPGIEGASLANHLQCHPHVTPFSKEYFLEKFFHTT